MLMLSTNPIEISYSHDELIITKTDLKGKITYANRTFMRVVDLSEQQFLNQPHNIIRHPHMPRGVFYGLWKTLQANQEFFGFIQNLTSDGNYYWVFANVTPDYLDGNPVGYYSVRRQAPKGVIPDVLELYKAMNEMEAEASSSSAPELSWTWLMKHIEENHDMSYDEFSLKLYQHYLSQEVK